jgi:glutamate racemase
MIKNPIGIFDSGYGGLTVLKEIKAALPSYDYIYLGDNARAPYGPLHYETVYQYTHQCVHWFFEQGCTLVILACNTASAKALRTIQQNDIPYTDPPKKVLGVIRPTSEVMGNYTQTKHIGIVATPGTVQSDSYLLEIEKFYPEIVVTQEACPEWVGLVEAGKHLSPEADEPVKEHIQHLLSKDAEIDALLLACTHYPLLRAKIREFTPAGIALIEQGKIVAESLVSYLQRHPEVEELCSQSGKTDFFTTGDEADFNAHGSLFYGETVQARQIKL